MRRTIASTLNDRGHRTTTGGPWSAHQVLRVLSNRIYLGELSFRGITATGCHPPIIEQTIFDEAQRDPGRPRRELLQARRERLGLPAHRADALPIVRQGDDRHPGARPQPRLPVLHLLHPRPVRPGRCPPHGWTPTLSNTL